MLLRIEVFPDLFVLRKILLLYFAVQLFSDFNKAVQKKPPDHIVAANKTWSFTFECNVTDATQEANITLVAESTNHTKPEVSTDHNSTTCLYSAKLTTSEYTHLINKKVLLRERKRHTAAA